jgi:hypothetical protein
MRFETEVCDICLADLGERSTPFPTADLPPAAAMTDLCFGDVMAELEALAQLAYEREEVAEAAHRAGSLLVRLRTQFLRELDLPGAPRAGTSAAPR